MTLRTDPAGETGPDQPSIARIRDYWLQGVHNTEADRELAEHILVCAPHIPYLVRAQRALLGRMVRYLVARGVRQFLDLGSGVPTGGHVHEVAQAADPECRVVYVDVDPSIVRSGSELLAGNERAAFLHADIRKPEQFIDAPALLEQIDPREPVALLLIETLFHIADSEDPVSLVESYMDSLCAGSYLGLSHFSEDGQLREAFTMFDRMFDKRPEVNLREPGQIMRFFAGLDLVEPGIVPVPLWHPESETQVGRNPGMIQMHSGLGRKP